MTYPFDELQRYEAAPESADPHRHPQPDNGQPLYPSVYRPPAVGQPGYPRPEYPQPGSLFTPQYLDAHQRAYADYHQRRSSQGVAAATSPVAPPAWAAAPAGVAGTAGATGAGRPRMLKLAAASGFAAAGLTAVSQVLALLTGRDMLESKLASSLPAGSEVLKPLVAAAVDSAYGTLQARALLGIGLALAVTVLVAMCLRAGVVVRICTVPALSATGLLMLVSLLDLYPTLARLVGLPAMVLFPLTAALLFMPAVGRYRAARSTTASVVGAPIGPVRD